MAIEYVILLVILAGFATAILMNYLHRKENETAEMVFWSNRKQPLLYEQPDATRATQAETIAQYETALSKLRQHGNRFLTDADVVLWIWGADDENTESDFARWQVLNIERRKTFIETFYSLKARQAAKAGMTADAGRMFAGKPASEFDDIEKNVQ